MYQILCCLTRGQLTHYAEPSIHRMFEKMETFDRSKHGDETEVYYTHFRIKYMPKYILKKVGFFRE